MAGAIARAAGEELQRESAAKAPIGLGEAVATSAGDMPSRWVIHATTMELGGPTSADIIRRATAATLGKADELGARRDVDRRVEIDATKDDAGIRRRGSQRDAHLAPGVQAHAGRADK